MHTHTHTHIHTHARTDMSFIVLGTKDDMIRTCDVRRQGATGLYIVSKQQTHNMQLCCQGAAAGHMASCYNSVTTGEAAGALSAATTAAL